MDRKKTRTVSWSRGRDLGDARKPANENPPSRVKLWRLGIDLFIEIQRLIVDPAAIDYFRVLFIGNRGHL